MLNDWDNPDSEFRLKFEAGRIELANDPAIIGYRATIERCTTLTNEDYNTMVF